MSVDFFEVASWTGQTYATKEAYAIYLSIMKLSILCYWCRHHSEKQPSAPQMFPAQEHFKC